MDHRQPRFAALRDQLIVKEPLKEVLRQLDEVSFIVAEEPTDSS